MHYVSVMLEHTLTTCTEQASVPEIHDKVEEQSMPSSLVFSQLLDLLQKLTACLQKNEAYLDFSGVKISSEERSALQPNSPQKEVRCLDAAANRKPSSCPGQIPSMQQLVNDCHKKGLESSITTNGNKKLSKLFTVTCWKWRWVAAASEVQELSKELNILKSISKDFPDKTVNFQQSSLTSCLENFRSCFFKENLRNTEHPSVDPLTLDKVLTLLSSIWNVSSQSAHQEKEAFLKNRQIEHLLKVMTRWMQRALKKRQLERVIAHWLRYLLQSWKDKFKHQNVNAMLGMASTLDTRLAASKLTVPSHLKHSSCHNRPKHLVDNVVHIKRSTNNIKARDVEIRTRFMKKGSQKLEEEVGTFGEKALETFQESLHHRLVTLEALIIKEANSWHQQHLGDKSCAHKSNGESLNPYSASTNSVWKICCELEHCFFQARNQIMTFFGVWNKIPSCLHSESGNVDPKVPGSSKGLFNSRIASCKKLVEKLSSVQTNARTRRSFI